MQNRFFREGGWHVTVKDTTAEFIIGYSTKGLDRGISLEPIRIERPDPRITAVSSHDGQRPFEVTITSKPVEIILVL